MTLLNYKLVDTQQYVFKINVRHKFIDVDTDTKS